ncbi:PREDICTED: tripartite motif-containing protein 2-like [Branchiostoma belcheri]|uniref:Tripartite motif-containing protein 2-like n=1 Tax=Branchiostoma belcheri TaxID=7741 RepID=A0A6P4ZFE0_BRABE|nr:PREDICTED: tripartite motif-containing protein 2-like [Branchiostoma belcheri]
MASVTERSFKQKILEEDLCCGICQETFRKPKALPCLHTFCQECLTETANLGELCCPLCRREVPLASDGVAGLPDNFHLSELCKKFSELPADPEEDAAAQHCEYHPTREIRLFCTSSKCGVPICVQCFEDSHGEHKVIPVKQAVEKRMTRVNPLLKEKKRQIEERREYLKEIRRLEDQITDGKRKSEENILESYTERAKLLAEDKDRLLDDVQQSYQDIMKDVNATKEAVLQQLKDLTDVVEEVEQTKERQAIKFLRHEPDELREKLEQATVDPVWAPLEVTATLCRPRKIRKEHLTNGELVSEVFSAKTRWQTVVTLLSHVKLRAYTAMETAFNDLKSMKP